jgi:hypothetical protein
LPIRLAPSDAFGLAPGDDATPAQRPEFRSDHRVPAFAEAVVAVEHDPITSLPDTVSPRGIGEERGVTAGPTTSVEDRQPGVTRGVEAPWCNALELTGCGFLPVLAIDVEQLGDAGRTVLRWSNSHTPEPLRQRVADTCQSFSAEPGDGLQPAVVRGHFEIRERLEPQLVM